MKWNGKRMTKKEDTPYVHIWLKFGQLKAIYPIDKKVKVTAEQLEKEDKERWVEVPDDYLKTKLDDLAMAQAEDDNTSATDNNTDTTATTTTDDTDNTQQQESQPQEEEKKRR